jgi:hypothetical protein
MAEVEILTEVKKSRGITGNYLDNKAQGYIKEVLQYLIDAGVPESVTQLSTSVGVITRGVNDLWDNGILSDYFYQRVTQLAYKTDTEEDKTDEV